MKPMRTFVVVAIALVIAPRPAPANNPAPPPPPYNPYPPGILPANLESELNRVEREIAFIFQQALAEARALPPPTVVGNPPTEQFSGYARNQVLGKLLNFDLTISPFKNIACSSCHMPYAAFGPPIPSVNLTMIGYPGSFRFRAGKRNPQRYTYSPFFPVLAYQATASSPTAAIFQGGNFWDSRATGYHLQSPDAEQAQHPPVDTQEHMFPDTACIAFRLQSAPYRDLFEQVWGADSLDIKFPHDTEQICATPAGAAVFGTDTQPIKLKPADRYLARMAFDHWGQSVDFYEKSNEVSAFTSKFDAFLAGKYTFTPEEMAGYLLFRGKGNCNSCHIDGRGTALMPGQRDNTNATGTIPVFTCFGSANEGLPLNPRDAFYYQTRPDFFGFTANPYGFAYRDLGLGTFLRSGFGSGANPNSDWIQYAPLTDGQFQVSSARNVALTPTQCPTTEAPGPYFQKQFFHNGYIKSLKQLVHFYNTRDVYPYNVTSGHCPPGTTEKVNCWPMPEVKNNLDMTTGQLGLTDREENQIVAFLQTLSDGYTTPYPNRDAYTGTCSFGGNASTQGNEFLIPTPPLPPCAEVVCGVQPFPNPPIP